MKTGAIVGIQDMGAAGLTCSTSEMGARAGTGIEIDVAKVPQRETGMTAYEVMLSESQERMLLVAEKGREARGHRVFEKWDLHAEAIGTVTADKRLRIFKDGVLEADVPNEALTDDAPLYDRPWVDAREPGRGRGRARPAGAARPRRRRCGRCSRRPPIANKRWIYRQYDSTVRTQHDGRARAATRRSCGSRARSARSRWRSTATAATAGSTRSRARGSTVAEACRNVAASGAVPIGATNCLNFGNPEKPEVMGQLVRAIQGIGEACRALGAPITGGNVSLYNETDGTGDLPDADGRGGRPARGRVVRARRSRSAREGDPVYLLGATGDDLGGSEYLKVIHGRVAGRPPKLDLTAEKALHELMAAAGDRARAPLRARPGGRRARGRAGGVHVPQRGRRGHWARRSSCRAGSTAHVALFSESPSRMIVTTRDEAALQALAATHGVPCARVGTVGGDRLVVTRDGSRSRGRAGRRAARGLDAAREGPVDSLTPGSERARETGPSRTLSIIAKSDN